MSGQPQKRESVVLLKLLVFSFIVIGFYVWFANSIPQLKAEPPKEEKIEVGALTMDTFVALGDQVFHGKGTCELCHNPVGKRAPLLVNSTDEPPIGARAEDRIKAPGYKGKAKNGADYIYESMTEPSAFVVPGYGKKGTNDTVSPMPDVRGGSIGLSDLEIHAVIAYFQSQAGVQVTVPLPSEAPPPAAEKGGGEIKVSASAQEAFVKFECKVCHVIPGVPTEEGDGELGPPLLGIDKTAAHRVKSLNAKEYIRQSILEPNAFVVPEFDADTMPQDLPERMTVKELEMIVQYLSEPHAAPPPAADSGTGEPAKTAGTEG